jgi:hypothetical protein
MTRYALNMRLDGPPHSQSGSSGENKDLWPPTDTQLVPCLFLFSIFWHETTDIPSASFGTGTTTAL